MFPVGRRPTRSLAALAAAGVAIGASPAAAQTKIEVVHQFSVDSTPRLLQRLAAAPDGTLYGISCQGGVYNQGAIYELNAGGYRLAHSFQVPEAKCPSQLIAAGDGSFFGSSSQNGFTQQTIFKFTPPDTFSIVYEAPLPSDSSSDAALGADGNLYWTRSNGTSRGELDRVTPAGVFSVVRQFTPAVDGFPAGAAPSPDGNVYVPLRTAAGDRIARVAPDGTSTPFYSFSSLTRSSAVTVTSGGTLYVYALDANHTGYLLRIDSLGQAVQAATFPSPSVALDLAPGDADDLYFSILGSGNGDIYHADASGSVTLVHSLFGSTLRVPVNLVPCGADLCGTADDSSSSTSLGVVFRVRAASPLITLQAFSRQDQIWYPSGVMQAADGGLYGLATLGGLRASGAIYRLQADGAFSTLHEFDGNDATHVFNPKAQLVETSDGRLCGTTDIEVFCVDATGQPHLVHAFSGLLKGGLIDGHDGKLYGVVTCSSASVGEIFAVTPDGAYQQLHDFGSGPQVVSCPTQIMRASDGNFYLTGGVPSSFSDTGSIFRMTPAGDIAALKSFSCCAAPIARLIEATDGNLYGTTDNGGLSGEGGTIFRITKAGMFTSLHVFSEPVNVGSASLMQAADGALYGFAGVATTGIIYRITLTGQYKLLETVALSPIGYLSATGPRLIQASDGMFYGTVMDDSGGYVFRLRVPVSRLVLETPQAGARILNALTITGWAADADAASGSGVDAVHVYALPIVGGSLGPPTFLGAALYGLPRKDVGWLNGPQFMNSGFQLTGVHLSAGSYRLVAYAHSSVTGTFSQQQAVDVDVTVDSTPIIHVDAPLAGGTVGTAFIVKGWAIDRSASAGSGIDAVDVWASPSGGGSAVLVGAASIGGLRLDVAGVYGMQFVNSGFTLTGMLGEGAYQLTVFARSSTTGMFTALPPVDVTVAQSAPTMALDSPVTGTVGTAFHLAGWAIDRASLADPGVDVVNAWALPAGGAAPIFLGAAGVGGFRRDLWQLYGPTFANCAFDLPVSSLSSGTYTIVVYARSTVTGTFNQSRSVAVTVQ